MTPDPVLREIPVDEILQFTQTLVATPCQADIDGNGAMLIAIARFLDAHGLKPMASGSPRAAKPSSQARIS